MTVILFAHAQQFQVTCRTHLTVSSHKIPHLSRLSASGTPQSLFIFSFCVPCLSLSVGLPLPVWGCLICKCLGGYYVVFIVHSTHCCRIEEPHLEAGLLYTAPALLCAKDAPVAQSSLNVQVSLCV